MEDKKRMTLAPADVTRVLPIATQAVLVPPLTSVSVGTGATSDNPSATQRPHVGRTPPGTPPASLASPCSPHAPHSVHSEGSVDSGGSPHGSTGKGVTAPATAVDDIAEKFGRPRAHSFSRQDRHASLPALNEEGDTLSADGMMEDRRRVVSMSALVEPRRWRPSKERNGPRISSRPASPGRPLLNQLSSVFGIVGVQGGWTRAVQATSSAIGAAVSEVIEVGDSCRDCRLAPSFAVKGERPSYCRAHKMVGMVSVATEVCCLESCTKIASYGFPSEGRQRCFTHRAPGMVHVLVASPEEDPEGREDAAVIAPNY